MSQQQAASSGWDVLVSVSEQHGADTYLHCEFSAGEPVLIHQPGQSDVKRGDKLRVHPHAGRWHLFNAEGERIGPS